MNRDTWRRVRSLFVDILDVPEGERESWLVASCRDEPEMRAELERLLEADSAATDWLAQPASEGEWFAAPRLGPGTLVGPYRLESEIATGGMGAVYSAVQETPRRTVALKTLRADAASPDLMRRFRAEAEVLGHMRHPGIAQIYDAGTHDVDGAPVPFIVMEFVEGARDLVSYATDGALRPRARLALFLDVCDAVHHGHQKGVIHRDLKPGNVLVDRDGRVKVIDFGLARAIDRDALDVSLAQTRAGEILGTLAYMSPEHVSGNPHEVDTRSDVYALGCLLCELLSGRTPHDVEGLRLPAAVRRISEDEPRMPSGLSSDVRWILETALARDPDRRYASASELAEDVRRHLRSEPLSAGPPSSIYRLRRFLRRNRTLLVGTVAVVVALAIGLWRAREEARDAADARDLADEARVEAETQSRQAHVVSFFMSDLLRGSALYRGGPNARIEDVLRAAEKKLPMVDEPVVHAVVTGLLGYAYLDMDDRVRAEPYIVDAAERLGELLPQEALFRLHAEVVYADLLEQQQRVDESLRLSRELLPILEREFGRDHQVTMYLRQNLAICLRRVGDLQEAETMFEENLSVARSVPELNQVGELNLLHQLGSTRVQMGLVDEGVRDLESALDRAREVPGTSPLYIATITTDLAQAWASRGEHARALEGYRSADAMYARVGATASNRFTIDSAISECLVVLGEYEQAMRRASRLQLLVDEHWPHPGVRHVGVLTLQSRIALGRGDLERAEGVAREAVGLAREADLLDSVAGLSAVEQLARALLASGDAQGACRVIERAAELEAGSWTLSRQSLEGARVEALLAADRPDEAVVVSRQLLDNTSVDGPVRDRREALAARASRAAAGEE